jgi:His-Xaa-Ser system radical SAM maturase HxsC
MARETPQLCITGGEPTLYFSGLLQIIRGLKENLPTTALHMLSNGRLFNRPDYAKAITSLRHPDFVIGIPLYSDQPSGHDYVVQSKGAFDETVLGLLNLARYSQRVEIRFVIHRDTLPRMVATARFIARNLPFATHIALMGLEPMGFGRTNFDALWVNPREYQNELTETVEVLRQAGLQTSIYNHQLCTLPRGLWPFAVRSISDWKNVYLEVCDHCFVQSRCAGFFASVVKPPGNHHFAQLASPVGQLDTIRLMG